jgi:hypothetical protein
MGEGQRATPRKAAAIDQPDQSPVPNSTRRRTISITA